MANDPAHWDGVYAARDEAALTWFEPAPELSLELVRAHARPAEAVLDVGGGASRLPDALLDAGYSDLTVLDQSAAALAVSRDRLGPRADAVTWIAADITRWTPPRRYKVWHDRAVFHFLTDPAAQAGYARALDAALAPDGTAVVMSFAPDGPEMCSGLPVARYAPEDLAATFEALIPGALTLAEGRRHVHRTPMGREQRFQVSVFARPPA